MPDVGLTHVALGACDPARSAEFYRELADMEVVHRRPTDDGRGEVLWISDRTRPFVLVLIPEDQVRHRLGGMSHLGVALPSREMVDERMARARALGHNVSGPTDSGPPVGYWGLIEDPDGHTLELSYGQEVGLATGDLDG